MFQYSSFINFVGTSYMFVSMLLISLSIAAAAIIAAVYLMKAGKKKAAAAIILAVFILGTAAAAKTSIFDEDAGGGRGSLTIWDDAQSMNSIGELNYVFDQKGRILGFGKLKITSGKAPQYLDLEFEENHRLIGSTEAMKYKKAIEASLREADGHSFKGKSLSWEQLNQYSQEGVVKHFSWSTFLKQFLIHNILTFVLVLVYFAGSYRERRRKANKMDSSKIQDL